MARYEHLPIFRDAYDLTVHLKGSWRNFSRYHKYTLGTDLRNQSRRILALIVQANNDAEKRAALLLELRQVVSACYAASGPGRGHAQPTRPEPGRAAGLSLALADAGDGLPLAERLSGALSPRGQPAARGAALAAFPLAGRVLPAERGARGLHVAPAAAGGTA